MLSIKVLPSGRHKTFLNIKNIKSTKKNHLLRCLNEQTFDVALIGRLIVNRQLANPMVCLSPLINTPMPLGWLRESVCIKQRLYHN